MQVIDNTPNLKQVEVVSLPRGTVFRATNNSVWMVADSGCAICLYEGTSARHVVGDIRDIVLDYHPFSNVKVLEAVLHVTA